MSFWLGRCLQYVFSMAAHVTSSGQPRRPGCSGRRGLARLNQELRSQWKLFETICWSWRSHKQAYWHLRAPCHSQIYEAWPRALHANRYTKGPDLPGWQAAASAVCESASPPKPKSGYYLLYLQRFRDLLKTPLWQPQCPTSAQPVPDPVPITVPDSIYCRELQFGF